jgi:hypothetical protein
LPTRGSHRSVRARIRAYGSSDHALARRKMIPVAHTPAHELPCGDRAASSAILRRFVDTLSGFPGIRRSSFRRSRDPTPRFPRRGPPVCGRVPALRRYYQGAATSRRPSRRASFPSLGGAVAAFAFFAPAGLANARPAGLGSLGFGQPLRAAGDLRRRRRDLPSSWRNPDCTFAGLFDPGRTVGV